MPQLVYLCCIYSVVRITYQLLLVSQIYLYIEPVYRWIFEDVSLDGISSKMLDVLSKISSKTFGYLGRCAVKSVWT